MARASGISDWGLEAEAEAEREVHAFAREAEVRPEERRALEAHPHADPVARVDPGARQLAEAVGDRARVAEEGEADALDPDATRKPWDDAHIKISRQMAVVRSWVAWTPRTILG